MKQITDFIQKLKNIDVSNLDISKIDIKSIQESLARRKDILIDIIIIIVTVFAIRYILSMNTDRTNTLAQELTRLEEKQASAIALEKTQTDFDTFKKNIPEGFTTETEIIRTILDLAQGQGVKVVDYVPAASQDEEYFSVQNVSFIFESSYAQMIKLVRLIEKNEKNLRITSWTNNAKESNRQNANTKTEDDINIIKWQISIGSTLIKND